MSIADAFPDTPTAPAPAPPAAPPRRRIGEVLVASGKVTEAQLDQALASQRSRGLRLGEVLLDLGVISPVDLLEALAEQFGLEFVDLEQVDIDTSLVQQVPEPLARRHRAVPIMWKDGCVIVAMANPSDVIALDDIRSLLRSPVSPVMADPGQLSDVISRSTQGDEQVQAAIRQAVADNDAVEPESDMRIVEPGADDAPIVRFVDLMIGRALQERASDIHVEPGSTSLRVRFRIDGVLHEVMHPPRALHAGILSRIKVMAGLDIAEKRVPQDGRVSLSLHGRSIDLRIATVPTVHGESAVMRLLRRDDGLARIADLGMDETQLERFVAAFRRSWGIVLVTGPTGSGKTTTLYSALKELNDPTRNIMTIEDPVEYRMSGIKQMQVNNRAGLTFARALRSILRADPDIVLVGEVRDEETATIAVEASLTGHLVLASLHTNDASSTPTRLIEMGVEPYLVVAGLRGVLAQRLVRRLCERCRVPVSLSPTEAHTAGIPVHHLDADGRFHMYRAAGCSACSQTGYRGRFAINEYLEFTEGIGQLVLEQAPSARIEELSIAEGMLTLREDGLRKVAAGLTTLEDLLRCIS